MNQGALKLLLHEIEWADGNRGGFTVVATVTNVSNTDVLLAAFDDSGINPVVLIDGLPARDMSSEMINYGFPLSSTRIGPKEAARFSATGTCGNSIFKILSRKYKIPEGAKNVELIFSCSSSSQQSSITSASEAKPINVWGGEVT